jgi:hypothetical protein
MGHFSYLALQTYQEVQGDPVQPSGYAPSSGQSIWDQMGVALHNSIYRVLSFFTSLLPGLLALILAIAILTAIGALVAYLLRRILTAVKFDERMARNRAVDISSSIQDWAPKHSPTVLIARSAFWLFVVLGFVIGISAFDASYSSATRMSAVLLPYLTHSVGAIILLIAGNIIARFLARSILIGAVNAKLSYARFLSLGVKWLVLVLTAAMVLDHLGIGGNIVELAFGILFGGIVLTLSLAVGLGSREIVSRSLERTADRMPPRPVDLPTKPSETLRHF